MIFSTVSSIVAKSFDLTLAYLGPLPWLTKQNLLAPAASAALAWAIISSALLNSVVVSLSA
jgi:hypothetical protein